jgi:hypothetical protein
MPAWQVREVSDLEGGATPQQDPHANHTLLVGSAPGVHQGLQGSHPPVQEVRLTQGRTYHACQNVL